ncbi:MAG: dynamin family protein [Myxococcales bacterium]|nr:dynamin family protein [Myxococcales bacterium]MCB9576768.1 dynamin family protein [Polyangiaceae bacterium]
MLDAFHERKLEVISALAGLTELGREVGANTLADRVSADVVQKLERDRFHLVVVGEFNHGKTTFVNALLGQNVLPIGVTPTTAVIHHIVWGEEPKARVVNTDGTDEPLPFDDVRSFAAGGQRSQDSVSYLEVALPAELLRERIVLVDTPGVNDLSLTRAEITYGYIPRSDAVLFVIDAGQPLKESERQFLEHQLIGKSRDKIVFVVAKADIWSPAEREEALAYVQNRLGALVEAPPVFAVSAQAALAGRREESGLVELTQHLTQFLAEERGKILLDNALGEGLSAAGVLSRGIDARRRAATMSVAQLDKRIDLLRQDLAGHADTIEERRLMIREESGSIKAWARRDLDRFCDDVVRQLPAVVERSTSSDLKQHLGPFLEHAFKEWAEAETREIGASLEKLAERMVALVKDDAEDVGKRVSDTMGADLVTPSIEVDRFAYDVGIFAVLSVGMGVLFANALLGGLLIAAAPALALWNRGRTEAEMKKRALELAPVVLRETAAKVGPKIDQMVDEFAERLDQWVVTAGQELHKEIIEVLAAVQTERRDGSADRDQELEACTRGETRLAEVRARLEELRAALAVRRIGGEVAS